MMYRFGIYQFDSNTNELSSEGRGLPLEAKPGRALALLLSRAGEIVTRHELYTHLWGTDTHVDVERGLTYCVGQVHAALGDAVDTPRFIETLPRRGFRFIAPVEAAADLGPPEQPPSSRAISVPPSNLRPPEQPPSLRAPPVAGPQSRLVEVALVVALIIGSAVIWVTASLT